MNGNYNITPHLKFSPFHNRHIVMLLRDGRRISGVVVDTLDMSRKKVHTHYAFVSSRFRREWLEALQKGDIEKKRSFERVFDIREVADAKHLY